MNYFIWNCFLFQEKCEEFSTWFAGDVDDRLILVHRVETELRSKDISLNFDPVHNRWTRWKYNVSGKHLLMQMTKIKMASVRFFKLPCQTVKLSNCVAWYSMKFHCPNRHCWYYRNDLQKLCIVLFCPVQTESHCANDHSWPLWQEWKP